MSLRPRKTSERLFILHLVQFDFFSRPPEHSRAVFFVKNFCSQLDLTLLFVVVAFLSVAETFRFGLPLPNESKK